MQDTTPSTWLNNRAVLRISGAEARSFLQGLVTQDVGLIQPDQPQWSGLLSPQGKALFDFLLWADGEQDILIDCEAAAADALIQRLRLYRLRRPVEIERTPLNVHWSATGSAGIPDPRLAALGKRWISDADAKSADHAWLTHRLSLGVTEGQAELGIDKTLWLECNAAELNGASFTKGCFVGQENTARMHYRSKVNRRLFVAPLGPEGERTRQTYPELGLMIEHRRCEEPGDAIIPDWLAPALEPSGMPTGHASE